MGLAELTRPEPTAGQAEKVGPRPATDTRLLVCGDSHSQYFIPNPFSPDDKSTQFAAVEVLWAPGASMTGITRAKTTLNLQGRLLEAIATHHPDTVVFSLGQVDAEMIYYHALMRGETAEFEDWYADRCSTFLDYIQDLPVRCIVKGPNPSTLNSLPRIRAQVRRRIMGSFEDRDAFREAFDRVFPRLEAAEHADRNEAAADLLQIESHRRRIPYYDIRKHLSDPAMPGMARREYIPPTADVHVADSLQVRDWYFEGLLALF